MHCICIAFVLPSDRIDLQHTSSLSVHICGYSMLRWLFWLKLRTCERIRRRMLDFVRVIYSRCFIPGILFLSFCVISYMIHVFEANTSVADIPDNRICVVSCAISICICCYSSNILGRCISLSILSAFIMKTFLDAISLKRVLSC